MSALYYARLAKDTGDRGKAGDILTRDGYVIVATEAEWAEIGDTVKDLTPADGVIMDSVPLLVTMDSVPLLGAGDE